MAVELRHLRYFVAVAEELHFGRAAERLHIAQPALSQQIQALERLLDTRLLQRMRRPVSLTDAGRLFLEEARLTLRQAERATTVGRRAGRGELGKVEIGYVASAAFTGVLSTVVLAFRKSHPAVELNLVEMDGIRQLEELAEGRLDIAFIRRPIPFPRGIDAVTLLTEAIVVALRTDHPLASRERIPAAALSEETFIVPRIAPGISFHEHTMAVGREGGFVPRILYHGRDLVGIASIVGLGLGVAIVPTSLRCVHLPDVVFRALSAGTEQANLSAAFRQPESAPAVQAFIAEIRQSENRCGTMPPSAVQP